MKRGKDSKGFGRKLYTLLFGIINIIIIWYYLSNTIIHYTTDRQFPINSFIRFPLTFLIFPAELFSFGFTLYFLYTILNDKVSLPKTDLAGRPNLAVLIPVYNEPERIIERTVKACSEMEWTNKVRIYILDDSDNEKHKKEIDNIAERYDCIIVRRTDRAGYKAGNINNAVKNHIKEDYFAVFDCDQAPEKEFLNETMDYFSDDEVGFVQSPQYYINDNNALTRAAKIGTNIFYQVQCTSKANDKAMPFCGTNVVIRKSAFESVNGFRYYSATEDIDLGIRMNASGYYGAFTPKILAKGYAPTDFSTYASQQYRWANGNLAILRDSFFQIFLSGKFSLRYQIHFLFTLIWWLIGFVMLAYIFVPLLSLVFSTGTHHTWLSTSAVGLLYLNVFFGIGLIYFALNGRVEDDKVTIKDAIMQYSLLTNSLFIYIKAGFNALIGRYIGFVRTDKDAASSGYRYIVPNIILAILLYIASLASLFNAARSVDIIQFRTYFPVSMWLLFYSIILFSSIFFVEVKK